MEIAAIKKEKEQEREDQKLRELEYIQIKEQLNKKII